MRIAAADQNLRDSTWNVASALSEDGDVPNALREIGFAIRAVTKIRFAIFDGQHCADLFSKIVNDDTLRFFSDTYTAAFPDSFVTLGGSVVSTEFSLDPPIQFALGISAQSTFGPCAPPLEEFQAAIDGADYLALWSTYIRPDPSAGPNIFVFADSAVYEGEIEYL